MMKKRLKTMLVFAVSLALTVGIFVNPNATIRVKAIVRDTYTYGYYANPSYSWVIIDDSAKTIRIEDTDPGDRYEVEFQYYDGYTVFAPDDNDKIRITLSYGTYEITSGFIDTVWDATVTEVAAGAKVGFNMRTVIVNNGTVVSNTGTITTNNGTVANNVETITTNNGTITANHATVANNYGKISANDGTVNNNAIGGLVYSNTGIITTDDGFSTTAPDPALLPPTAPVNTYNKVVTETLSQLEALGEKLANGEKVEDATVYLTAGDSLPLSIMKTLKACPGVTLDFRCTYKGEKLHFVLKGGEELVINENIPWYGPMYLKSVYGVAGEDKNAGEKQTTTEKYVIQRGDTLYRIARQLGTSLAEILGKNPQIKDPNRIWTGQLLNY